ncbi:unnamed protein product, partial [Meganyctiphanes norvegica]
LFRYRIMKAPTRRNEITKDWVHFMLNEYENRTNNGAKVTIKSLDISKATKPGDGYSGDLMKLDITAAVHCDGEKNPEDKEYNLIVKLANPNQVISMMQTVMGQNIRELTAYSELITDFNKFQSERTNNELQIRIPEYIYGKCADDEFVLVMQNMKSCDFDTNNKIEPMNIHQAKMVLEQLARLHAISYAYDKKYGFLKKFPFYKVDNIKTMFNIGFKSLYDDLIIEYIGTLSGRETLLKKIKAAKSTVLKDADEAFEEGSFLNIMCLMHGDTWNNNIIFKQKLDKEGEKSVKNSDDLVLIDWQLTHWNTSVADLYYFLFSSTTPEIRKDHLEELLQYYHYIFIDATTKLSSPVPFWTYKQFKQEYNRLASYGFLKGIMFTLMLSDAAQEFKFAPEGSGDDNFITKKIKTGLSKLIAPMLMKPFAMEAYTKKMIQPMKKELLSGKTPTFSQRILSIVLEAEENGLFDVELPSNQRSGTFKCI